MTKLSRESLKQLTRDQLLKLQAKLWNDDLFSFAKHALNYEHLVTHAHGAMVKVLEGTSLRKLIIMPRGSLKSSVASVAYPIWMLNRNPNLRILIVSELFKNSKNLMREIKNHMENPMLTDIYGQYKSNVWNESEIIIQQRTRVYKEASITCGGLGTEKTGQHYDLAILDDLNSSSNTNNPENAEKVIDYFRYLQSIMEPNSTIVIVATRYSALDLPGFVLDNLATEEQRERIKNL